MRRYLLPAVVAFGFVFVVPAAYAQSPSCTAQSAEKKLAGAAKTSFMKKCETDATTACEASATEKKLSGAARTSFTKKCISDHVGS